MKIGDITIFGEITVIDYLNCFIQFRDVKTGCYHSKTFEEIEDHISNQFIDNHNLCNM